MAYDTKELKKRCIEAASDRSKNLHFLEDIYVEVGIDVSTFYSHFPKNSKDYNDIRACLTANKIRTKKAMRKKWYDADNATLQVALYKMIGTDRDRQKLTQTHQDVTSKGEKVESMVTYIPKRD